MSLFLARHTLNEYFILTVGLLPITETQRLPRFLLSLLTVSYSYTRKWDLLKVHGSILPSLNNKVSLFKPSLENFFMPMLLVTLILVML